MPDLGRGPEGTAAAGSESVVGEGSVSLFVDDDVVLVVMHGSIGHHLHQDVRDLVDDLECDAAASAGRPVRVLMRDVTELGLQGVWLLLELRRAARPAAVVLVEPAQVVRAALQLHGLSTFVVVEEGAEDFPDGRAANS